MTASGPDSKVPSVGAVRRLQALHYEGWTWTALESLIDSPGFKVSNVPQSNRIVQRRHLAVVDLCGRLDGVDPVAWGVPAYRYRRSMAHAMQQGWVPLSAWMQDIDDPRSVPYVKAKNREKSRPAGSRRFDIVHDTAELAGWGCGIPEISERLGIEWASVLVAHSRAGVQIPERLVA
jgi:hypothetical protein